jgi:hypothetical protein
LLELGFPNFPAAKNATEWPLVGTLNVRLLENEPVAPARNTTTPPAAVDFPAMATLMLGAVVPAGVVTRILHGEGAHVRKRALGSTLLLICNSISMRCSPADVTQTVSVTVEKAARPATGAVTAWKGRGRSLIRPKTSEGLDNLTRVIEWSGCVGCYKLVRLQGEACRQPKTMTMSGGSLHDPAPKVNKNFKRCSGAATPSKRP